MLRVLFGCMEESVWLRWDSGPLHSVNIAVLSELPAPAFRCHLAEFWQQPRAEQLSEQQPPQHLLFVLENVWKQQPTWGCSLGGSR